MLKNREYFYALIAILLGLAGSLVLGEVFIRLLAPEWLEHRMDLLRAGEDVDEGGSDLFWPYDRLDGRFLRYKPLHQFRIDNREYHNSVQIDAVGGRSTCDTTIKPSRRSLVVLGDSMTFGLGVEDCETFSSLLAQKHREFRTLNLGVPGTALPQQLFIASKRQSEIGNAEIYLFFFFLGNDFSDLIRSRPFWWESDKRSDSPPNTPPFRENVQHIQKRVIDRLNAMSLLSPFKPSYLLQLLRSVALQVYLGGRPASANDSFQAMYTRDNERLDSERLALRDNLSYLKMFIKKNNARSIIVAIPDKHQIIESARKNQAKYYGLKVEEFDPLLPNRILTEESARANISLVDSTVCLDNRPDKADFYYVLDTHLTKAGHKALFECIDSSLNEYINSRH